MPKAELVDLYAFADFCGSHSLGNCTIDVIYAWLKEKMATFDIILQVYRLTAEGSPLRRLIADWLARRVNWSEFKMESLMDGENDHLRGEILLDTVKVFYGLKQSRRRPYALETTPCHYHVHPEGEAPCPAPT